MAVYMVMMAADTLDNKNLDPTNKERVKEFWGSLGSAILSVWWSISGGQDWADLVNPLIIESGNNVHNVIYSMFIAFATMVIMNLVTGVFVEGAQRLRQKDKDEELQRMAKKTFKHVDEENHNALSRDDFEKHLFSGDLDTYLTAVELTKETACDLFDILDEDKDGTINFHEFVDGCIHLAKTPRVADIAQVLLDVRKDRDILKDIAQKIRYVMDVPVKPLVSHGNMPNAVWGYRTW
mmetsp:Transcript_57319/g.90886  ORF Transcript_57319/g.90886 Transcript_57319/m.90886 type:complete len:237 (+) Transcript_57319:2-712(+)